MKKTGLALLAVTIFVLIWEVLALSNPADDIWTITAFLRALPVWAVFFGGFIFGGIAGHAWWK